ncbi:MAG TPA: mechanosensitive ion channel family protein [Vicinamibacteria bacterium]|nr:mechanosensitive ion channel family protein [Vicinamibacteria bacterium]
MEALRNPWVALPGALLAILVVARLARLRPGLRPLLGPFSLTALVWCGLTALAALRAPEPGVLLLLLLVVPLLVFVVRGAVLLFDLLFRRSQGEAPPALLESVVAVLLYAIGAGAIAHYGFGFELTPFLAGSAVVGAVVGLALQDTLGNLFSGIALNTDSPFRLGDWVRVGDQEGRVEQVSWRSTRLRSWFGDSLVIPNAEVSRRPILNFSQPREPHSRVLHMGVNYHTPPNKVFSVLENLLEQVPEVLRDPRPVLRIVGYRDFSVDYEVRYFLARYEDYRAIEGEVYRLIWYHFRRHGIEIPFPIRTVYMHQVETGAAAQERDESRLERALRAIDLFRPLSDEELRLAAARFRHLHYAQGERIIEEGAPGDSFFVIDRGEVEVGKSFSGVSRPLARLMEGQFFGEMALLTGARRAATVTASTDVDVFTIDKDGFQHVIASNPAIAVDISTILAERREALSHAEDDVTARFDREQTKSELKQHLLNRIRGYFGL